jgi:glutamine amidotransferase
MSSSGVSVCILDYGSGNVGSVRNLIESLDVAVAVSNDPAAIEAASHIVLPGVGAFAAAMRKIRERLPCDVIEQTVVRDRRPFLGICVGMQVLATRGYEFEEVAGLGWIPGIVRPLEANGLPLPHIGWNDIIWQTSTDLRNGLEQQKDFYFLHGYAMQPEDAATVQATACYGEEFCSIVQSANILGVQFHPEKSQLAGTTLMRNFLGLS